MLSFRWSVSLRKGKVVWSPSCSLGLSLQGEGSAHARTIAVGSRCE